MQRETDNMLSTSGCEILSEHSTQHALILRLGSRRLLLLLRNEKNHISIMNHCGGKILGVMFIVDDM